MNKLNPIKYIENMLSHHPKSISLWITEGIVINGERYVIKEFRLRDGSLYAVIAENKYTPKYFEVKLAPDEETLKDIYQAIKDNKIAIEQEITDRKNEISRVDSAIKSNTTKINQEITDRKNEINRVETKVDANTAKINQEITDRQNDISRVNEAISANTAKINKEITDRQNEISRVDGKIEANTAKINKEITDRQHEISRVDNAIAANTEKINQEITDRTDEINRVNESIESNTTKINQEITDRRNEISRVDNAIKANTAKITQEIADRKSDIGLVNGLISANTSKINKEVTDRQSEISRVENKIAEVQGSIKPIVSGDTGLLTVANEDSQIKLNPQHDSRKEQVLESRQNTLTITKGGNGTSETTKIDTNPQKVLLHENLSTDYGISKTTSGNTTKLGIEYTQVADDFDLNNLVNGRVRGNKLLNSPYYGGWYLVESFSVGTFTIQKAISLYAKNQSYVRFKESGSWGAWRPQAGDMSVIDTAISTNTAKINKEITDRQAEISRVDSKIEANAAKINKEITDRKSEITRVEGKIPTSVGGRNLWIQSKATGSFVEETLPENHITGQKKCYRITNNNELSFNIEPDFSSRLYRKVTFSAWVKYENVVQGPNSLNVFNCFKHSLYLKNSSTGATSSANFLTLEGFSGTSDWKYITYTYDYSVNKSYDQLKSSIRFNIESAKSGTAWVTGVKIELGSIPSDWSPAPEDYDSDITKLNTTLTQTANGLEQLSTQVTSQGSTIISHTNSINSLTTGLSAKVSQTDFNTLSGRVTTAENNITAKANELSSKITSVEGKIPTSIGGRNLLTKTNQGKTNWSWVISSGGTTAENYNVDGVNAVKLTRTSDSSASWHYIRYDGLLRNLVEPNTQYTLSFDVKPSVDVTFTVALMQGDWSGPFTDIATMNKATANQWTKVSCVLTSKTTLPDALEQVVCLQDMPTANGNWLIIKNIKLEKGVVSSDWSPAPEDYDSKLDTVKSEIKQTTDAISARVTSLDSSTVKNSSLTINADGTVMKAGKTTTDIANAIGSYFAVNQNAINKFSDKINVKTAMIADGAVTSAKIAREITLDMLTCGKLNSTNGVTAFSLNEGTLKFTNNSGWIQRAYRDKVIEITDYITSESVTAQDYATSAFVVRKSDNSKQAAVRLTLDNTKAEATITSDLFYISDPKNKMLFSVDSTNKVVTDWGDIPIAHVLGGLVANDISIGGRSKSLLKIIDELCKKAGITWF